MTNEMTNMITLPAMLKAQATLKTEIKVLAQRVRALRTEAQQKSGYERYELKQRANELGALSIRCRLLAYAMLRGRTYAEVEPPTTRTKPEISLIAHALEEAMPLDADVVQDAWGDVAIREWVNSPREDVACVIEKAA